MTPRRAHRRPRSGAFGRFLASLVALAVIVVGIPALLVACSRAGLDTTHPFPGVGTTDEIRGYLDRGLTTSEITPIALRSLLIVAWLLWAVMVLSVLGAIIEAVRGHRSGLPQVSMFAGLGRWIAAGLTALTAVAPNFAAAASLPSPRPFVISSRIDTAAISAAAPVPVPAGFGRVLPGESLEMFAQRTLGDGSRWREIWDLNNNQPVGADGETWTAPWKLAAGWDLVLPVSNTAATDASSTMPPGPVAVPSLAQIVASRPSLAPVSGRGERAVDQHRVEAGDSYWSIAEHRLGSDASSSDVYRYTTALMEFNAPLLGYQDPAMLHPGDVVAIIIPPPGDDFTVAEPTDPGVGAASTPHDDVPVRDVEAGDSYWEIAQDTLGADATPTEVSQLTTDLVDLNSPMLGYQDRRMIHPGDVVYLQDPVQTTAEPPHDSPTSTEEPAVEITVPEPVAPSAPEPTSPPPLPDVPTPAVAPPLTAPTQVEPADDTTAGSGTPVLAGITGAVALATGLTARMVWLRRRRATRGARHTRIAASHTEQAIIAAADVPLVRWAGQHLARMLGHIDRHRLTAAPVAVEISDEAGIEVLWDQPQQAPPSPGWTSADGGWAWRLAYDPDAAVPPDELPAAIPALVTIGRRDGRQLLVDLEAFGTLAVTGPDDLVDNFLRSIAVELAVGNDLSDAHVTTVNIDAALVGHCERLSTDDLDHALRRLETARRSTCDSLERAGLADTFTARAGDTTPIDVVITIAGRTDQHNTELIANTATRRSGIAAIIATDHPLAGVGHVRLDPDGTARIEPLGVTFVPVALNLATAAQLRDTMKILGDLDNDGEPAETVEDDITEADDHRNDSHRLFEPDRPFQPDPSPPHEPSANGDDDATRAFHDDDLIDPNDHVPAGWASHPNGAAPLSADDNGRTPFPVGPEPLTPGPNGGQMMVRVLGVPSIPQRPDIGRREVILAALLACRGGTLAATTAQDALWGGKPVEAKTVWNFVAKARSALGEFDDGCPVMPSADRTRGTLRLDSRVKTDLSVLLERLEQARQSSSSEAVELLRDGLALVDGPPFDAAGYDWAHRDQDVAYASTAIETAVETLVELALEAGVVDVARDGITRGLRGLPGNEQLYRCRMRVEHHIGNHAGIINAYNELTIYLADLDTEPSPVTTALFHELSRRSRP